MDVDKEDYAPMQDGDIINNLKILQLDEDEIQPIESDEDDVSLFFNFVFLFDFQFLDYYSRVLKIMK